MFNNEEHCLEITPEIHKQYIYMFHIYVYVWGRGERRKERDIINDKANIVKR